MYVVACGNNDAPRFIDFFHKNNTIVRREVEWEDLTDERPNYWHANAGIHFSAVVIKVI